MKLINIIISIFQIQLCSATIKVETLEPISSSNKTAIFHASENRISFIKLDIEFIHPENNLMVKVDFYKKEGSKFRQLFKSNDIDWCKIVSGKSKANPLTRTFLMPLISKTPFISKCPFQGHQILNIDFDRKMLIMFPSGTYKLRIYAYSKEDNNIATCTMIIKIDDT